MSRDKSALKALRRAVAADPTDIRSLLALGDLYLKRREYDKTLSSYERVAQQYMRKGTLIKAVAVVKQMQSLIATYAPELAARYDHIHPQLARMLESLSLVDDAASKWLSIARRRWHHSKDAQATEAALREAIRIKPNDLAARGMLAELYMLTNRPDDAIVVCEQIITIALAAQARDEALSALERLATLRDDARDARLAAEVLLDRNNPGDAQAALAKLQISHRRNRRDMRTMRLLVRAFDAVQQPRRGDEVLKEAARVARDSGARDTFRRIVEALQARNPNDPSVAALLRELSRLG